MLLVRLLRSLMTHGTVEVIDAHGRRSKLCEAGPPKIVFRLHDPKLHYQLLFSPNVVFGEAYTDGRLTIEEGTLAEFLEAFGRSEHEHDRTPRAEVIRRLRNVFTALAHYNPAGRARRNVAHHYDLSGELYELFLDADRQYSCAYFKSDDDDIELAQRQKRRHIAAKMAIEPGMKVLDIGSGWGGMALYLAKTFDCEVVGVTLSTEQYRVANERAREAGLADRCRFEFQDYRELDEQFDRIVSVGMLEHVGQFHYPEYFRQVRRLLKPDGVALIHTIGRMAPPQPTNAWIRRYIFPGGYLPSPTQMTRAIERNDLWLTDFEVLRDHYARTLERWNARFQANRDKVRALYDENFCRMWELYLLGCAMGFRWQDLCVFQMQLTREIDTLPITRDYMTDTERRLEAAEEGVVADTEAPAPQPAVAE